MNGTAIKVDFLFNIFPFFFNLHCKLLHLDNLDCLNTCPNTMLPRVLKEMVSSTQLTALRNFAPPTLHYAIPLLCQHCNGSSYSQPSSAATCIQKRRATLSLFLISSQVYNLIRYFFVCVSVYTHAPPPPCRLLIGYGRTYNLAAAAECLAKMQHKNKS